MEIPLRIMLESHRGGPLAAPCNPPPRGCGRIPPGPAKSNPGGWIRRRTPAIGEGAGRSPCFRLDSAEAFRFHFGAAQVPADAVHNLCAGAVFWRARHRRSFWRSAGKGNRRAGPRWRRDRFPEPPRCGRCGPRKGGWPAPWFRSPGEYGRRGCGRFEKTAVSVFFSASRLAPEFSSPGMTVGSPGFRPAARRAGRRRLKGGDPGTLDGRLGSRLRICRPDNRSAVDQGNPPRIAMAASSPAASTRSPVGRPVPSRRSVLHGSAWRKEVFPARRQFAQFFENSPETISWLLVR